MNLFIETPRRANGSVSPRRAAVAQAGAGDRTGACAAPDLWAKRGGYPERGSVERNARPVRERRAPVGKHAAVEDRDEPEIPFSQAQQSYQEEMAFDRKRHRGKRRAALVRVLAYVLLLPVVLFAVFIGAYALTCILNGATPEELNELMQALFARMQGLVWDTLQMIRK